METRPKLLGAELYRGHIDTCIQIDDRFAVNLLTALELITNSSDCGQTNVSSNIRQLIFCDDYCINTTKIEISVSLHPGTQMNVPIAATGQFGGLRQANFALTYDERFHTNEQDLNAFISADCTNITWDIYVDAPNIQVSISCI